MGHVWLGFSAEQIGSWLEPAGLERLVYRSLPADPAAKGPTLFAATATVPVIPQERPPGPRVSGSTVLSPTPATAPGK